MLIEKFQSLIGGDSARISIGTFAQNYKSVLSFQSQKQPTSAKDFLTKISKIEQEKTIIGTNINKALDFITNTEFSKNNSGWRKNLNSSSIAIFILHNNIQEFDKKLLYDLKTKVHRVIVIAIGVAEEYLENLKVR